MTITVEQLLERSFVISVDDFRYNVFCERFRKYGLGNHLPKFFRGFEIKNGIYKDAGLIKTNNICNCWLSHVAIIKMAMALNWPFIVIFEDDALPCRDIVNKLRWFLCDVPDNTGLLKFGWLENKTKNTQTKSKFTEGRTLGSHAYMVFNNYYDDFIKNANKNLMIDVEALNTDINQKIYSTSEMLFIQDDRCFRKTLHDNTKFFEGLMKSDSLKGFEI